jgi:hypothetical protein
MWSIDHYACRCYSIHGLGIYMYRIFKYYISMNNVDK